MKKLLEINLQRFADGNLDNPAPAEPSPAPSPDPAPEGQPAAQTSIDDKLMNLFNSARTEDAKPEEKPVNEAAPNEPIVFDFNGIMERIKAINPNAAEKYKTPEALAETVVNQEKTLTSLFQDKAQLIKQLDNLRTEVDALKGQQPQNTQPQQQTPTDEFDGLEGEAFMDKLYEDPKGFLSKFAESVAKKAIEPYLNPLRPVIEQQQNLESWDKAVNNVLEMDPDMVNHIEEMRQYLNDNGLINSKDPQKAVMKAYIETLKNKQAVDPKAFLKDQQFVQENVVTNPDIVNAILKSHMQSIKGNQVPPAITGSSNGQPLATPPTKAKTMEEGFAQFESMLMGNFAK